MALYIQMLLLMVCSANILVNLAFSVDKNHSNFKTYIFQTDYQLTDQAVQNIFILPDDQQQQVQLAAFSRMTRYRGFFNTSQLELNETLCADAEDRALQFANQMYAIRNGESVFSMCEHPKISSYTSNSIFFYFN
jgi:hypothetical protein